MGAAGNKRLSEDMNKTRVGDRWLFNQRRYTELVRYLLRHQNGKCREGISEDRELEKRGENEGETL